MFFPCVYTNLTPLRTVWETLLEGPVNILREGLMKIFIGTNDLAEFFGVTRQALQKWKKSGCPQEARGKWNLKAVFDWWWENIGQERAAASGGNQSINEAKRLYWNAKAERERHDVDKEKGLYILVSDMEKDAFAMARIIRYAILSIPDRLSPLLAAEMDQHRVRMELDTELRQALEGLEYAVKEIQ